MPDGLIFDDGTVEATRAFFTQYVRGLGSGRRCGGPPALRHLPNTAFSASAG
jgi:hypothetical protein